MATEDNKTATAPYISFRTFLTLLDRLESGGIPQHIDRHYWGSFLAGGVGQQAMVALRFLGLITPETNEPTPALERLVPSAERKAALAEMLRERYSAVWENGVDPARTTPGHLDGAFGKLYNVEGETRRKAVTFFVHAAKFAELPLSSQITAKSRQRRGSSSPGGRARPKGAQAPSRSNGGRGEARTPEQRSDTQNREQYAILHEWLRKLPPEGKWTTERRERWLNALRANVDFLVTLEDEAYDGYDDEEVDYTLE